MAGKMNGGLKNKNSVLENQENAILCRLIPFLLLSNSGSKAVSSYAVEILHLPAVYHRSLFR